MICTIISTIFLYLCFGIMSMLALTDKGDTLGKVLVILCWPIALGFAIKSIIED